MKPQMRDLRTLFYSLPLWAEILVIVVPALLCAVVAILWDIGKIRGRLLENYPVVESVTWEPFSHGKCPEGLRDRGAFPFLARTRTGEAVQGYVCWGGFTEPRIHVS